MKRKIAPAVLIVACLVLAVLAFRHLQSQAPPAPRFGPPSFPGFPGGPDAPATAAQRAEAISSITGQLDAFRRDDYAKAAYYQSPMLQFSIGSPERFESMMKAQYPEFANSAHAIFGDAQSRMGGERVMIPVTVTGKDGVTVSAVYTMQRSPDGVYRVVGVMGGQR